MQDKIKMLTIETAKKRASHEFFILRLNKKKDLEKFESILSDRPLVSDSSEELMKELYEIRFPSDNTKNESSVEQFIKEIAGSDTSTWGTWVYYSWSNKLVHFPPETIWEEIRTARNKTLITKDEQDKFWNFKLGIVGLSVGQSAALSIVRSGGCKNLKLADPDTLAPSNLNRLQGDLSDCGAKKISLVRQRILELDPYYNLSIYEDGLSKENIKDFFTRDFKLDAIIDACDSIPIKIAIRLEARELGVPVLMATDAGDGVIADVERYDIDKSKAIFGGRIDEKISVNTREDFIKTGLKIIAPEYISLSLNEAMKNVGKTIPTHPQLGSSAQLGGTVLTYLTRKLSVSKRFPSERTHIDLEEYFDEDVIKEDYKERHAVATEELKKAFDL